MVQTPCVLDRYSGGTDEEVGPSLSVPHGKIEAADLSMNHIGFIVVDMACAWVVQRV